MSNPDKVLIRWVTIANLFDWCFDAINKVGIKNAIQGNSALSDVVDTTKAQAGNTAPAGSFTDGLNIRLNVIESLSLAYLALYIGQLEQSNSDYVIGVEEEDVHKKKDHEESLGDGLIMKTEDGVPGASLSVQETKVIGLFPKDKRMIEDIAISNINKKIAIRDHYPDDCRLLVSILSPRSGIDYKRIAETCNLSVYEQALALEYIGNDLSTCAVINLSDVKNNQPPHRVLVITPRLRYLK